MSNRQLKLLRMYSGLTQREFAELIGVAPSTVAKIEAGFTYVTDATKAKILRKFDLTCPEFTYFCIQMDTERIMANDN